MSRTGEGLDRKMLPFFFLIHVFAIRCCSLARTARPIAPLTYHEDKRSLVWKPGSFSVSQDGKKLPCTCDYVAFTTVHGWVWSPMGQRA